MSKVIDTRYEVMWLVEAKMCNHNGDPDMANLPRQDSETNCGILTDVAIKRRIRNYIESAFSAKPGMDILMKSGTSINRKIAEAMFAVREKTANAGKTEESLMARDLMCEKYWDVRTFGGVLSTGLNAGQVRGAVQIAMATSVDPIHIEDMTITRMCYTDGKDFKTIDQYIKEEQERPDDKKRTMGDKKVEAYGLYVVKASVSAALAEKCGFTEDDFKAFLEAVFQSYSHDISSSKMGMNVLSPIIVFQHVGTQDENNAEDLARERKLGCAPAYKLFDLLKIEKKDVEYPRCKEDYNITLSLNVPNGVRMGVKTSPVGPIIWDVDQIKTMDLDGIIVK